MTRNSQHCAEMSKLSTDNMHAKAKCQRYSRASSLSGNRFLATPRAENSCDSQPKAAITSAWEP
eukprot:CAMPEP_0177542988 /NCGR_PEP_ID=MMETSP0369-20130122/61123_1 /TAXON_ID=447022 ORGANISM="Scrippsiella hangoei-like, Strain SHHI-4" /NCGR_SAMPLE_ID=MMETSP0369 /ASSEMBLY_ACC=CAM_ASM_000364 /LENGTH=63 /DNA_ID=CAMNT_0019026741 /DNA_START=63 /DNA_END=251 /DNA_ORIENTATION=-